MTSCSGLARGAARQKSQKTRIVAESKTTPGSGESQVLEPYREELVAVGVESTYNWYWLVGRLQEAGDEVQLVNTAAIRQYEGLKHRSDEHEAFWIAHLMSLGILPTGTICPPGIRAVRDLLRKRLHLVRHRTSHLLSVQNPYARHQGVKVSGADIKSMELDRAGKDFSDAHLVLSLESSLSTIRHLGEWIVRLEGQVAKSLRLQPEFRLLQSVYRVGKVLAMTIALETPAFAVYRDDHQLMSNRQYDRGKRDHQSGPGATGLGQFRRTRSPRPAGG